MCGFIARAPVAVGLRDVTAKAQGRLMLRCLTRNNPIASVTWFKDGKVIHNSKRIRIKTKRYLTHAGFSCIFFFLVRGGGGLFKLHFLICILNLLKFYWNF